MLGINAIRVASLTLDSSKLCRIFKKTASLNGNQDECIGHLKFKCNHNHCSLDKENCEKFLKIYSITTSFFKMEFFEKKMAAYKNFVNSIQICPMKRENIFNLNYNVCSREETCKAQKQTDFNGISQLLTKKVACPCIEEHKINCNKWMCASSRDYCKVFRILNIIYGPKAFKSCQNGNRTFFLKY